MADLVSGRYPETFSLWSVLGQPPNATQADIPARTNLEYLGVTGLVDSVAALVTQVMTVVAVPVDPGTTVAKISVLVGATAAGTPTNSFAALYSGTTVAAPPLIGQSTDGLTAAIAASGRFDFTLTTAQLITPAQAPNGFIWAAIMVKATTVPSLVTVPTGATAAQYAWFTNTAGGTAASKGFAITSGAALTTTAPATLISASALTTAPVVFLT